MHVHVNKGGHRGVFIINQVSHVVNQRLNICSELTPLPVCVAFLD